MNEVQIDDGSGRKNNVVGVSNQTGKMNGTTSFGVSFDEDNGQFEYFN